jgi:hypothetical protein
MEQPAARQSKPGGAEDLVQALGLGLRLDLHGARDDHRVDPGGHLAALDDLAAARRSPIREFVHEPMNTRSSAISWIGVPARRPM